jgi:hypothetical protein
MSSILPYGTVLGQVIGIVARKGLQPSKILVYAIHMTTNQRLTAAIYLSKCCDAQRFWELAATLLIRGYTPEDFDATLLTPSPR